MAIGMLLVEIYEQLLRLLECRDAERAREPVSVAGQVSLERIPMTI